MIGGMILLLLVLFYALGMAADVTVGSVSRMSKAFGVRVFYAGIILAFFTSFPEFAISLNALLYNIPDISIGNLLGGTIVLFGLIFGVSIVVNRRIRTDGKLSHFIPTLAYLFLPFILAVDGTLSVLDGVVLVVWYGIILYQMYRLNGGQQGSVSPRTHHADTTYVRDMFTGGAALVLMLVLSHVIVSVATGLLTAVAAPPFLVGLLVFSIGTNLPELIVTIRSWKNGYKELSMSHLTGSAILDPLLIGLFAIMRPYHIVINGPFVSCMFFTGLLFLALAIAYKTGKVFSRQEGWIAVTIYLLFVVSEIGTTLLSR